MTTRPDRTEAATYYFKYIDQVADGDICDILAAQEDEALALFRSIADERSLHRYAPGKWTIRDVIAHVNDTERLFVFRALWLARGFDSELPSFEPDIAAAAARGSERPWGEIVDEFRSVRASTVAFFRSLPDDAWTAHGIASGNPFSVRALAYLAAGHLTHHLEGLREQYLTAG